MNRDQGAYWISRIYNTLFTAKPCYSFGKSHCSPETTPADIVRDCLGLWDGQIAAKNYQSKGKTSLLMTMGFRALQICVAFCILTIVQPAGNKPLEAVSRNSTADMYLGTGCPTPTIKNGFVGHLAYKEGDSIDIHCGWKYRLEGPDSLVCHSNDSWSGSPRCVAVGFCEKLPDIANGFVQQPDRAEAYSNATFSCQCGFKLKDNKTVMCVSEDGIYWTWNTTSIPSCEQEQEAASCSCTHEGILVEENNFHNDSAIVIDSLILVLLIFVVLCLCLISYLVYDKFIKKDMVNKLMAEKCTLEIDYKKKIKTILTENDDLKSENNRLKEATRQHLAQLPNVDLAAQPSQEATTVGNNTDSGDIGDIGVQVRESTSIAAESNDDSFNNIHHPLELELED